MKKLLILLFIFNIYVFSLYPMQDPKDIRIDMEIINSELIKFESIFKDFFSDMDIDLYNLIRPFLQNKTEELIKSPTEVKEDPSNIHKIALQAAKEALALQKKELDNTRRISEGRISKKKTTAIASICSLGATVVTAIVVLTIHFTSK